MSRLTWDVVGERFYEAGVDRGVLYVDNVGYSWNGLISVQEKSSGGEPTPYYVDGFKYINLLASEEFEVTIEAFACPIQFAPCDGTVELYSGLSITQQRRKAFGLSYRTKVGNDVVATDLGYKLHVVYNALASPSDRANVTAKDRPEPTILSWDVTTTAAALTGRKPTSHFVIDSRRANPTVLTTLENMLYGTSSVSAALPTPAALVALFA